VILVGFVREKEEVQIAETSMWPTIESILIMPSGAVRFWLLDIVFWNLFEIWCLFFGILNDRNQNQT